MLENNNYNLKLILLVLTAVVISACSPLATQQPDISSDSDQQVVVEPPVVERDDVTPEIPEGSITPSVVDIGELPDNEPVVVPDAPVHTEITVTEPLVAVPIEPIVMPEPEPEPTIVEAPPVTPPSSSLRGRLQLNADDDDLLENAMKGVVIYFVTDSPSKPAQPGKFTIETRKKRLVPDVLVIPKGSEVSFPNFDDILHNVFSVSPVAMFDLGFISINQSPSFVFNKPGTALIHCNVHHAMRADILVLDTPFFTQPDAEGNFQLSDLPNGGGELHIWHPQANAMMQNITLLPSNNVFNAELLLTKPRVPPHLNKLGESYRPERPES